MARCLIGVGSNLGKREQQLRKAVGLLAQTPRLALLARSRWHETTPAGGPAGQDGFLNGALLVETALGPEALLDRLQEIERQLGRRRSEHWGPREVDLDLLLYGERQCQTDQLELPHPRMSFRRFVLEPAAEIAPWMRHPASGWTVGQLLRHLNTAPEAITVGTADPKDAEWLAGRLRIRDREPLVQSTRRAGSRKKVPDPFFFAGGVGKPQAVKFLPEVASTSWERPLPTPQPKLVIAWDCKPAGRTGSPAGVPHASYAKGPLATITTADRDQALAEALAAASAVWPNI